MSLSYCTGRTSFGDFPKSADGTVLLFAVGPEPFADERAAAISLGSILLLRHGDRHEPAIRLSAELDVDPDRTELGSQLAYVHPRPSDPRITRSTHAMRIRASVADSFAASGAVLVEARATAYDISLSGGEAASLVSAIIAGAGGPTCDDS